MQLLRLGKKVSNKTTPEEVEEALASLKREKRRSDILLVDTENKNYDLRAILVPSRTKERAFTLRRYDDTKSFYLYDIDEPTALDVLTKYLNRDPAIAEFPWVQIQAQSFVYVALSKRPRLVMGVSFGFIVLSIFLAITAKTNTDVLIGVIGVLIFSLSAWAAYAQLKHKF